MHEAWCAFWNRELKKQFIKNENWLLDRPKLSVPRPIFGWLKHRVNGGYTFGPVQFLAKNKVTGLTYEIGKTNRLPNLSSEHRLLGIHGVKDRVLLKILNKYLSDYFELKYSKFSFAYRKKAARSRGVVPSLFVRLPKRKARAHLSVAGALNLFIGEVQSRPYIVKVDIKSFFDSISHNILLSRLFESGVDYDAIDLVRRYVKKVAQLRGEPNGVIQGSSISGTLANIYLNSFDKEMERNGICFVRYCDDITIMAPSARELKKAYSSAVATLLALKLELNQSAGKCQWVYLGSGEPKRLKSIAWERELSLLGFLFDNTREWWVRPSTMERAMEKIRVMTNYHIYKTSPQPLPLAVQKINRYLGYEQRGHDLPGHKIFRVSRGNKWRGWVTYFARVKYSPVVLMQMKQLDIFIIGRLQGMQHRLGGTALSDAKLFNELGLRTAVGMYCIKCRADEVY